MNQDKRPKKSLFLRFRESWNHDSFTVPERMPDSLDQAIPHETGVFEAYEPGKEPLERITVVRSRKVEGSHS